MPRLLRKKVLFRLIVLVLLGIALQNIPGTYTLEEIEERMDLESSEGTLLTSLGRTEVEGTLYFKEPTRHRISRNAEIEVPEDTWLRFKGVMLPERDNGELVLKPAELDLQSDRPLMFIYRSVTVARARQLRLNEAGLLQAVGYYQVLSALRTGHRYARQREIRRAYEIPSQAWVNLSVALEDLEPMVNDLMGDLIPYAFDLGSVFEVRLERLHHLQFLDNHLDLHVDGTLRSAQSRRVSRVLQPSFRARLGVDLHLPSEKFLSEATFGVSLRNIHTFNFSGLNPLFDRMLRGVARSHREEARVFFSIAEDAPEVLEWPGELFIEAFSLLGEGGDDAEIQLRIHWEKNR